MIDQRRPDDEHAAAYRAGEPRRSRDPFAAPAVQIALAGEAERRARRPRDGWLASLLRSVANAPRAGLVGAALSLACSLAAGFWIQEGLSTVSLILLSPFLFIALVPFGALRWAWAVQHGHPALTLLPGMTISTRSYGLVSGVALLLLATWWIAHFRRQYRARQEAVADTSSRHPSGEPTPRSPT